MSDNIIRFGRPTESGQESPTPGAVDELRREFHECLSNTTSFLANNMDALDHFILCAATKPTDPNEPGEFHILSSRMSVGDFALSIAMLNKALNRNI